MKRGLISISLVGVIAIIGFLLVRNKKTLDSKNVVVDRSQVPVAVHLYTVEMQQLNGDISLPATLKANEEADISTATAGRIASLSIDLGSTVRKGQVVGQLDMEESRYKLESAQLSVEKLNRDYERNKVLAAGNATNANTVKDSKYDVDTKELEVRQLKKQITNGNIIAPISGVITDKKMVVGEYTSPGSAIASVVDVYHLKAQVNVPENTVFQLKTGQKATISSDVLPGQTFEGTITYISPKGDDNHNYLLELTVQNDHKAQLKAGLYVIVAFKTKEYTALQIPKLALVDGVKDPYVYVSENSKAVERKIVVGKEIGENIEVVSGLTAGEQIITSGQINIVNGSNIKSIAKK